MLKSWLKVKPILNGNEEEMMELALQDPVPEFFQKIKHLPLRQIVEKLSLRIEHYRQQVDQFKHLQDENLIAP